MNIYEAINKTMEDVGVVGKNEKNPKQGWKFRGIDAVMNALNPAMIKNHIFVVPEVLEVTREERTNNNGTTLLYSILKMKYTFFADDGSNVNAIVIGEAMDSGDKSMNKAMSAAFKYACFQTFCIPTEEMKDPDNEVHEVQPKKVEEIIVAETITESEVMILEAMCEKRGLNANDVFPKLNELTPEQYVEAVKRLNEIPLKEKASARETA